MTRTIDFVLRRRIPKTGAITEFAQTYDPTRTAIIIVDAWDYHWCKSWVGLAGGRIPRLNEAIKEARRLGFTIIHAPTDAAFRYAGTPQRERIAALPRMTMPNFQVELPPFPKLPHPPHCMCGGLSMCGVDYGCRGIDPRLEIAESDLISGDGVEVFTWIKTHGLTHVIHAGFATNMCMTGKLEGMTPLMNAGLNCVFTRDLTEAWGYCKTAAEADWETNACVEHLEGYAASIDFTETLENQGLWPDAAVDTVRVIPWGSPKRPGFFRDSVDLTMSFPFAPEGRIRYSLDGSEPTESSPIYHGPIKITMETTVRVNAFVAGKAIGLDAHCYYAPLPPKPPTPDVHLSDLAPVQSAMAAWLPWWSRPEYGSVLPPQKDQSYSQTPLTLRKQEYARGMGVHAPAHLIYAIEPTYARFVAQVGMDEAILRVDLARDNASIPSSAFRVFIDGELMAESPIMRLGQDPWSFDIPIPPGSKTISLAVTDGGDDNRDDRANWVNAGFVLRT